MNKESQSLINIKDVVDTNQTEKDIFTRIKNYRAIISKNPSDPIDPENFAKFNNIEVIKADVIDNNELIKGFLAINKDLKANIFVEDKKQTDKEINYTIAYLSTFYIATQDSINSPGLVHDYIKYNENDGILENICHQAARKILMPENLFRKKFKEYQESNNDIQILTDTFPVETIHIDKRIKDLGL